MARKRSAQATIFTGGGELVAGSAAGGSALTTHPRSLEVRYPMLAFIERRAAGEAGGEDAQDAGITRPPLSGPPTPGPTSGQWGSG